MLHLAGNVIQQLLDSYGYLAVFLFIAVESLGVPFPGEIMLITASAYAGAGHLQIWLVIVVACTGAVLGYSGSYVAGRTGGRALLVRYGPYLRLNAGHLSKIEDFFQRHGDKTVFLGRFVVALRSWAAFFAGMHRMRWRTFVVFNLLGAIAWTAGYGLLAFFFGKALLERISSLVGESLLVLVVLGVAALIGFRLYRHRAEA